MEYYMSTVFSYVKGYGMSGRIRPFSIWIRLLGKVLSWKGSEAMELPARKSGEYLSCRFLSRT